ncbi:hypothetical protein PPERSA_02728 [Pseudocohnilembus persalinus]|uniref:Uncharacterized protein n=1 Tax=Pseudocohnilembus persalinus TaxID=266149 RepID=A0A0V0R738_PSEPJ|nr:hypothetical protein PPERSA_02728 [Pseudocohnilembus persalinus]|eukprot:KRX10311.1 hypothetical protein PPERSA_02728 [Pseudocohnilembus persalinus]
MKRLQQNQDKTNEIFKTQLIIVRQLKDIQNNLDQKKLQEIIQKCQLNQNNIQNLYEDQIDTEDDIKYLLQLNNQMQSEQIQMIKQGHNNEVMELQQINEKLKKDYQNQISNLKNQWQEKYQDLQNQQKIKQGQFQDLQKKVLTLSKCVAIKKKQEDNFKENIRQIFQPCSQLIDKAKTLDYNQVLEKKQQLIKKHQSQFSSLKQAYDIENQKKKVVNQNLQKKQINQLQKQQNEEINKIDQILENKEQEFLKIEKTQKEQEYILKKQEEVEKEEKEEKLECINSLENISNIDKDNLQNNCIVFHLGIFQCGLNILCQNPGGPPYTENASSYLGQRC